MVKSNIFQVERTNNNSLFEMLNYVLDTIGHQNENCADPIPFYTGFGINPECAYEDMTAMQNFYNIGYSKDYHHFEISLACDGDFFKYYSVFYLIGEAIYKILGMQLLMAVHVNKYAENNCIHCHYVLNNVNCLTGSKFWIDIKKLYELTELINSILKKYQIPPVNVPINACKV